MRQRGHFHSFTLKAARHFQSLTHYMHAAARTSLFHSSTLKAARRHLGILYVGGDGLPDRSAFEFVGLLGFAFELVVRVL